MDVDKVNDLDRRIERIEKVLSELKHRTDNMYEWGLQVGRGNLIVDALQRSLEHMDYQPLTPVQDQSNSVPITPVQDQSNSVPEPIDWGSISQLPPVTDTVQK